jgi:hypothetical protein
MSWRPREVQVRTMNRTWGIVLIAGTVILSGCSKDPPPPVVENIEGVVTLDGVPLKRVQVLFVSESPNGWTATGVSDDYGHFTLTAKDRPGPCEGENQVLVKETPMPEDVKRGRDEGKRARYFESLGERPPVRYSNLGDNSLKVMVNPEQKKYDINLTRD